MAQPFLTLTPEFGTGIVMAKMIQLPGPVSYNNTGTTPSGSIISASVFGFTNLLLVLIEAQDSSGTYWAQISQGAGPGNSTFTMQIFSVGGSTEVTNTTNLSGFSWKMIGYGN